MRDISYIFHLFFDIMKKMRLRKSAHTVYKTKISPCMDNSIPKKYTRNRGKRLLQDKSPRGKEILL